MPKRYRGNLELITEIGDDGAIDVYTIDSEGEIHGLFQKFTLEGELLESFYCEHGEKDGLYQEWWSEGTLCFQVNYGKEGKEGWCYKWNSNGMLHYKAFMKNSEVQGIVRTWDFGYTVDGFCQSISSISYCVDHKADGLIQEFYKGGQILKEYKKILGKTFGSWKMWDLYGSCLATAWVKAGTKQGRVTTYFSDGNIKECAYYHDQKKTGVVQSFRNHEIEYEYNTDIGIIGTMEDVTNTF